MVILHIITALIFMAIGFFLVTIPLSGIPIAIWYYNVHVHALLIDLNYHAAGISGMWLGGFASTYCTPRIFKAAKVNIINKTMISILIMIIVLAILSYILTQIFLPADEIPLKTKDIIELTSIVIGCLVATNGSIFGEALLRTHMRLHVGNLYETD